MLIQRVAEDSRPCKPKIPSTRYEYQSHINGRLKHSKLAVIVFLLDKGARRGFSFWKQSNMAKALGIHQDTVRGVLKELAAEGWIQVVRRGHYNEYLFPWHHAWTRADGAEIPDRLPYKGNTEEKPVKVATPWHNPALVIPEDEPEAATVRQFLTVRPYFSRPYEEYRERARLEMRAWFSRPQTPASSRAQSPAGAT